MVPNEIDRPQSDLSASRAYLECRLREEADAAARADSVGASLAHLVLATRYAECFGERSGQSAMVAGQSWVDEHRLW
jgi:hypothetical protein